MDRVLKKRIAVLGSTGSIGQQTLEIARAFPEKLEIMALAAGSNASLLDQQVQEFQPKLVSLGSQGPSLEEIAAYPDIDLVVVLDKEGKSSSYKTLINNRMEIAKRLRELRKR